MRTPLYASLLSLAAFLAMAVSTTASPAPGPNGPLTRARFNCPPGDSPAGISSWLYPDLYSFCTSGITDCDCYPSDGNPAGAPSRMPQLNVNRYKVICRQQGSASSGNLQTLAAVDVCRDSCMCYGGPEENWSRHPRGPDFVGPTIPLAAVVDSAGREAARDRLTGVRQS